MAKTLAALEVLVDAFILFFLNFGPDQLYTLLQFHFKQKIWDADTFKNHIW